MKKSLFTLLLVLGALFGFAQSTIDPLLAEEMARRGDDEQMKVIVIMKAQYDRAQLCSRADYFVSRAERRDFLTHELKEFAAASQYDLKRSLAEMERNGMVTEPTTLWMSNSLTCLATKSAIQDLARRNDIEIIGYAIERCWLPEDETPRPASATREITQNVLQVGANQVWTLGYTGQGVVVAVVDTGVNYNHLDVVDHLWDGGDEFPLHGYDVYNNDNNPMDDHGHGSHCAGTVLGNGKAGSQTGMAPDATLMCVKCINSNGNGGAEVIAAGMEWAVEHGCDVFSMSLGVASSTVPERTLLRRTCVASLDLGIAGAIAAGNEGNTQWQYPIPNNVRVPGSCPPPYMDAVQGENPGDLSCSICIGAVDGNDNAANFSSRGPVTWTNTEFGDYPYQPGIGLIRPDVCAPGVNIKSLDYQGNNGYTTMSGTSMATPCAAGCIALMLSKDPNLMPADICRILEETAVPLAQGKSNTYGFGRINVLAAVEAIQVGAIQYNLSYQIHDPEGNNNNVLNPGESVTMGVAMVNISSEPVSNVSLVLTTWDENVTITQNTATCPDFAPDETMMVEDAFAFTVSDNVVAKQDIRFNLEVYVDGEQSGTYGLAVTVYDSRLEFGTSVVLNDDNGNGLLEPGETADLRIFVDNTGNQLAEMVMGTLSSEYEFVAVNDTEKSFSAIGADMMGYADFNVTLAADAPEDFVIPFTLDLVDFNGRQTELTFSYKNACNIIFSLHDSNGNGWQGNYITVNYSDGMTSEQLTIDEGSSATYIRSLSSGSRFMLRWHSDQGASQCSFEVTYEDGTVIFENQGGFSGNKVFTIDCNMGSSGPGFCEPIRNLDYELNGLDVVLTWEAPQNGTPAWYEIYRETELLDLVEGLTYTDVNVDEGVYNYCVYAAYDGCQSEYVCTEVDVSKCGPVQNLRHALLTNDENIQIILTWEAPENPTGLVEYQVYVDDELLGATNELIYYFNTTVGYHGVIVKSVFEDCDKDNQTNICILGRVENLNYALNDHVVDLTWDALEYVSQYDVYINQVLVATVEDSSYSVELPSGIFEVMVGPVEDGCYRFLAGFDICIVDPVSDLSFVAMDYSGLHFTWSCDDPYVHNYEVIYNGDTTLVEPQGGATEFSFDPIVGENTICVITHSLYGCDSEPVCLSTEVCAVDGYDYSFIGNVVTVTWNGDADTYIVRGDFIDSPTFVETNGFSIPLEEGGEHHILVEPVYEDCVGLMTDFWFEVTNIVPEIRISDVHEGYITTEWNTVDGAISYNLYRDGELIAENLTETNYKDTEMAIDAEHCYAVQSVFEKGVSDLSEAACANYFNGLTESDGLVSIYPNPTTDKVKVECVGMNQIDVYNMEGKLIRSLKVEGHAVQIDGLENGVYMLRILKGDMTIVRKVVKQ